MLSCTGGYERRSRVLGRRRDDTTLRSTLCPGMRVRNFCRAHMREASIRAALSAKKEEELRRSATELFELQENVLYEGKAADEERRAAAIDNIVAEMKREKSYENWSLDAAVAEHMASLRLRRCPYSHHREMLAALRQRQEKEGPAANGQEPPRVKTARPKPDGDATKRRRVFGALSPLQKCVVCLLWQGRFEVPQKVVRDVRGCVEAGELLYGEEVNEADIEAEEQRIVTVTAFQSSLGVVDLSSIPHVVAYLSQHANSAVICPETAVYFTGSSAVRIAQGVTEKQIDLSSSACAHELVEAIVWVLRLMNSEAAQDQQQQQQEQQQVVLRFLSLRRCAITNAEALVNALRKHNLDTTLLALDLSENRLLSLRFLFTLRAYFSDRLLRLSLRDNPITRKPEYREQVRKSLPKLTSLDGAAIRRPPLSLPHPSSLSHTFLDTAQNVQSCEVLSSSELEAVVDGIARFFYVWETRRVPWTLAELKHQQKELRRHQRHPLSDTSERYAEGEEQAEERAKGKDVEATSAHLPEEELDDDNFHHRYLHPSATFSMTVDEGLAFFKPDVMRLSTEVEQDDEYVGMRLSPLDVRDLRVFDVSMKGNSRNLMLGRSVLHRHARGSLNCYTAYKYSVYPPRLEVCHNLSGAVVSVAKITGSTTLGAADSESAACGRGEKEGEPRQAREKQQERRKKQRTEAKRLPSAAASFLPSSHARKPSFYIVTVHGVMSWRAPTMRQSECVLAAYDRVITLVENALPPTNFVEKRRSAPLLVFNDQVHFRPANNTQLAWFVAQTGERVARLVVEFGLEMCADGERLVRAVVERTSSDAAARAAMRLLIFHFDDAVDGDDDGDGDGDGDDTLAAHHFDVCSLIAGDAAEGPDGDGGAVAEGVPHRVTLRRLNATVDAANEKYTASFARRSGPPLGFSPKEEKLEKREKKNGLSVISKNKGNKGA